MRMVRSVPHEATSGLRTHVSRPVTTDEWKACESSSKFISSGRRMSVLLSVNT